jgi:hypothetical protein
LATQKEAQTDERVRMIFINLGPSLRLSSVEDCRRHDTGLVRG